MANTNLKLVGLDFDSIKSNLKEYLKRSESPFSDVDYEGSNISSLLDVLSYNTYLNSFYLNMVASEMFLDSATLRDSVISHAKELNYVPRSFKSAQATVSFTLTPSSSIDTLLVPKGTSFTTKIGSNNYNFTTDTSAVFFANSSGVFNIDLTLYEGNYVVDTFIYSTSNSEQRFVLSNPTVDTRSITVLVLENGGANTYTYTKASSLLDLTANSQSYFIQAAENSQYEVLFGDDVLGRRPQNGSTIVAEYRICNGELPNGAYNFYLNGPIQGQSNVSTIVTNSPASGGGVAESLQSIKFNAPRYYQNQDRAITATDYENLLLANFPEIDAISAYGGEEIDPPEYGRVIIAVDVATGDGASLADKARFLEFIKRRTAVGIEPVFVDPDFLYVELVVKVEYNTNVTSLLPGTIETSVRNAISTFNNNYLNGFKKTLRYSKLIEDINKADPSILGVQLALNPFKTFIPTTGTLWNATIKTGAELTTQLVISEDDGVYATIPAVRSTSMIKNGSIVYLMDDANGVINLYTNSANGSAVVLETVGAVDYTTGTVTITNLKIDSYTPASGEHVHLYFQPLSSDISSTRNTILTIRDTDVEAAAIPVKE